MSETFHPAMVEMRRAQIGAALVAMDLPYESFDPLFEHFTDELMERFELEAGIDWSTLRLAATVLDPEFRWKAALLLGQAELDSDRVSQALDLAERFSPQGARIGMVVGRGKPVFHVELRGDWPRSQPFLALQQARVSDAALGAYDDLCGKLLVDRVAGLRIELAHDGPARFTVGFPIAFAKEETAQVQAQVRLAASAVGAPAETSEWMANVVSAFAPHPTNRIEASLTLTPTELVPRLSLAYPTIPSRLVLKLATSFGSDPHTGMKLGMFVGSTTRAEDTVDRLELTVGAAGGPEVRFAVEGVGPPAVGEES